MGLLIRRLCLPTPALANGALLAKSNVTTHSVPLTAAKISVRSFCEPLPTPCSPSRKLILYSKPGCCLCDNLKEKLQAVFLLGGQDSLSDVQLQVRDITTNADWEAAYQYEIPVLARVNEDDSETVLPRFSPRLSIKLIHKKLSAVLSYNS